MSKPDKRSTLRRSRDGCLPCRRKRKKCDEEWPVCSRCYSTRSSCTWPPPRPIPDWAIDPSVDVHAFLDIPPCKDDIVIPEVLTNSTAYTNASHPTSSAPLSVTSGWGSYLLTGAHSSELWTDSGVSTRIHTESSYHITPGLAARMWEYAHDLGPRIIWPPEGCTHVDELDPEGVASTFRQSITALIQLSPVEPVFQDVFYFYTAFLTRLFYDYASTSDAILKWIFRKFNTSNSAKYGMLCLADLFRADYERSMMVPSWRAGAREMYSIAINHLACDLEDPRLSPWEKLTSLVPIMDYEFHTGQVSKYFSHVTLALPLVKAVVGGDTIDLLNLRGEEMFDVSMWAWCDILDSMATSTPTRLKYESNLECAAGPGTGENAASHDRGIERMYGIPNVLAVLLARTSALRHAKLPEQEKTSKALELERVIRNWHIRPLETKDSRLRVARVGAQEIWRHTAILYVHHAIFKSGSSHPVVKDSVKNIVKIASTLEPGANPDSFLYLPYFISAFYSTSQKDRCNMRSRMINSANALFLRNMARYLDELWKEHDSAGCLTSWSEKKPPRIAF